MMCLLVIILYWFFGFSDVLCPNVHVEGDRFKHTNGGTDEIPGKETHFSAVHLGNEIV